MPKAFDIAKELAERAEKISGKKLNVTYRTYHAHSNSAYISTNSKKFVVRVSDHLYTKREGDNLFDVRVDVPSSLQERLIVALHLLIHRA